MPFTPYHLGPALATKSIFGKRFCLLAFAISQIIIDLESLYYLIQDAYPVHRFFHTYIGATIIILLTIFLTKYILKILKVEINQAAIAFASILGAYSHIVLDSIMHSDIKPFYPFSESNHLLKIIDIYSLHELCIYSGIVGLIIIACKFFIKRSDSL